MKFNFDESRERLCEQFTLPHWIEGSGEPIHELEHRVFELEATFKSKAIIKAKTFELIAKSAKIAIDKEDIFQDKLFGAEIMLNQRERWEKAVKNEYLKEESEYIGAAWQEFGAFDAHSDYGHTSPNSRLLLNIGLSGLCERITKYSSSDGLTEKQKDFYASCLIAINAIRTVAKRLAEAIKPYNQENSEALWNISEGAPRTTYEAMQLIVLYYFMHEYVAGTRVRTLGRLDELLYPFYIRDIAEGRLTKDGMRELLKYFLHKFWSANVPYDLPFCLGGIDRSGNEITNELSYLIVEVYNGLNIYSPKIHIRVSDKTPENFVKLVLSCIRGGNSSFVFTNDNIGIKALMKVGVDERDARDYVPIGCYEPAVWGVEIGCTGNGGVNLAKAAELVFTGGKDFRSGRTCGVDVGEIESFDDFVKAVKAQITYMATTACDYITKIERHYDQINPDPILSAQYDKSVESGIDVYEGGAKYNNSSIYFYFIASLVDAMCAVKRLVFEDKRVSYRELSEILMRNWDGSEDLRYEALHLPEKYGNNNDIADSLTVEICKLCAELVTNRPNGRGGVFKAALFSIDFYTLGGRLTMATADGRLAGEPLSKNLSAVTGMDKNGLTALIRSVTKIDLSDFPTGSVLDVVLHPSAVMGEDGLSAFYGILKTYMALGGFAMHGNVFRPEDLKKAQENPEKYKNLQVRVCGWNAYFVNLSKAEQDAFIKQAEGAL